ncbi:unnamed protein product [Hermetia illucens]|uniref:Transcription activator mbf2 n=1 Tax=Hermetia illucens TaxID=343691 RepID=A0A7R8YXF4_HERIL|nr:uncharacterized protein LOC119654346 [Hermetia illucens]CAD7088953.1 unnamed protein product [Hermetia illucens]
MFSAKSLLIVNVLFVACQALALDYPDNEIAPIEDAFDLEKDNTVIVQGVDNIDNFQKEHPELTLEELDVLSNVRGQMVYTLGNRAAGDRLVGKAARKQTWSTKQNVKIQLTYPSRGVGAMVTYVHIVVNQSTKLGRAYVVKGGLHQHQIGIVVEAYKTKFVDYHVEIYGI